MERRLTGTVKAKPFIRDCILGICIIFMISSCGGEKEVKQVSQDSRMSEEAFSIVEAMRTAYLKKDFASVADICTKEGYREFIGSVKHFDSADLEFTPRWVEIEKSKLYLNVAWKGNWVVGKDTTRERGMAVFLLEGTPLKLVKVVRGNPFRYPER